MATVQSPKLDGKGLNLHYDRDLVMSAEQVLDDTADTASTNAIDLGSLGMTKGTPVKINIFVEVLVGTLTIKLAAKSGSAPSVDDILLDTVLTIATGLGVVTMTVPQTADLDYVRLFYSAGTSGQVSANVTVEV